MGLGELATLSITTLEKQRRDDQKGFKVTSVHCELEVNLGYIWVTGNHVLKTKPFKMGEGVEDHGKHPSDTLYRPTHTLEEPRAVWSGEKWGQRKHGESPEWSGGLDGEEFEQTARWTDAGLENMVGLRLQPRECRREATNNRERS